MLKINLYKKVFNIEYSFIIDLSIKSNYLL